MKISISKTELNALPHIAWNKFCYFVLENQANEAQYTPTQKTAVLCFWYHAGMFDGGHSQYLDDWKSVNKDELAQELRIIGASEFADNLIEAVNHGQKDDYAKTDTWFLENEETLVKAIEKYLCDNVSEFYKIVDEDYTMRQPKSIFWIGAIGATFFFGLMVMFLILGTEDALIVFTGFAGFGALGTALAIYAKLWKITVKKDTITVYTPFRQPREFHLDEISKVRHTLQGLIVYVDGKRTFGVDNVVNDYDIFSAQLHAAGKMESTQCKDNFTVRRYKGDIAIGIICALFFTGVLIWVVFWPNDTVNAFVYIGFSALALLMLYWTIYLLFWKITVSRDVITVKRLLTGEKQYNLRDIAKADLSKENLVLYVGNKKIAKVAYNCGGYPILIERLESENIPFYEKGRLIKGMFPRTSRNE